MTNARLEELRAKFQENPRRYFAPFANELRKAGDPGQAIAVCRTHLAGQPAHVSGHIVLGQALYEAGQPDEARDVFTTALELDPENLIALRTLGEIAQVNGDFGAARQWYERLLDADPRNVEVAQLLRDIPTERPPAPVPPSPAESLEQPTPFTVREEYEAPRVVSENSPPPFHTSFTGSQPAVSEAQRQPAVGSGEAVVDATQASESDEPFIDLEPTAHDVGPGVEPPAAPVAGADESGPLEMVDVEAFAQAATGEPRAEVPVPDELSEIAGTGDMSLTPEHTSEPSVVAESTEFTIDVEALPAAAVESRDQDAAAESEPPGEHPRAVFAERGFDGPTNDEVGWMTTPSAAFSDLEAAPETWFDEPPVDTGEVSAESPAAEESPVEEPAVTPDYASDSWFEEAPGAAAIEATDVTSDELWLPPEMPHVTQAEDNTVRSAEGDVEPPGLVEAHEQEDQEPDWSSPASVEAGGSESLVHLESPSPEANAEATAGPATEHEDYQPEWQPRDESPTPQAAESVENAGAEAAADSGTPEPARLDVDALADAGEEAVVVEHAAQSSMAETWSEAEPLVPDEDRLEEPMSVTEATAGASFAGEREHSDAGTSEVRPPEFVMGHTPASAEVVSTPPPAPFITETLAELYLQQGFHDEALSIYRQLAERDPTDESLRIRIASIEQRDAPATPVPRVASESQSASQSVRTFFSRIARRPAMTGGAASSGAALRPDDASNPDVPFATAASALANLFAASRPPVSDEGAASTLAGAFTDPASRTNRDAERELSLDHLFRDVPAGGSPGGGVTLDEFYSTPNAEAGSPTESGEAGGSEESGGADIRQFTAWLEGLRKK